MTYSVVAATADGEVGGASTSCVSGFSVGLIYGAVPGVGVVHAQARLNQEARDEAVARLGMGQDAATVMGAITDPAFDGLVAQRQFLIATPGGTEAFTGDQAMAFAGHRQGAVGDLQYALAGNILTGEPVLTRAEAAFVNGGCDLAERLVLALEAGAENGEGDSRCTPDRPSTTAYLRVESPMGGEPRVEIDVVDSLDPLGQLRTEYEAWRTEHPCPGPLGEGGAGGSAGFPGEGGTSGVTTEPAPESGGCAVVPGEGGGSLAVLLLVTAGIGGWRRRATPCR